METISGLKPLSIYTWKELDGTWGCTTAERRFNLISAFGDTELEALKQFCIAMIATIEVIQEDINSG